MLTRSKVRGICARMRVGAEPPVGSDNLIEQILPLIPMGENWSTYKKGWDISVDRNEKIYVFKPESDIDFIRSVCAEAKMKFKYEGTVNFDDNRSQNIVDIIESSMLDNLMNWNNYNETWNVEIDQETKHIKTKYFKTIQNIVTPKMISESVNSDGSAMSEDIAPPVVQLEMQPVSELSDLEKALLSAALKKKIK